VTRTELDHFFVMASRGAPEADRIVAAGLSEGQPNRHPGQGTACRRFFFANAYVELLWVEDEEEAKGELVRPLQLWERWSGRSSGACPFGVVLRPGALGGEGAIFPSHEYRPAYLPPPLVLEVGANSEDISEAFIAQLPVRRRPDSYPSSSRPPLEHRAAFRELTAVRLFGPWPVEISPVMRAAQDTRVVAFYFASEYFAEIGFDGERHGHQIELRPHLPLLLRT
jgi:Glyoxalase-like domain